MMRKRAMSLSAGALAILGSLFPVGDALTQISSTRTPVEAIASPIGKVVSATGMVSIEHRTAILAQANLPGNAGPNKVGDLVYQGDVVSTGADAAVGITFTDGTVFNVASNARIVLNEFVYDPKGKSNSTFFSLSKGTFTFIAGKVARTGNMKIETPIASMGIRGTTAHVEILPDGTVSFSTLIEDKKAIERVIGGSSQPSTKQRQAKTAAPRGPGISIIPRPIEPSETASPTGTPK